MEHNPYTVIRFNKTSFHTLFSDGKDKSVHSNKTQIKFICDYLEDMHARTIIVENDYIDRSYLEDYSAYYSRCFNSYKKKCKRLHFFKDYGSLPGFSEEEFRQWMIDPDGILTSRRLKDNYLGFIVVRPLPETVLGRTCLEAYPETSGEKKRHFPVVKEYEAGLCGLRLKVKRTLPFQEQDKITSACATSALWSLFYASSIHSRLIQSPSSITRAATSGNFSGRHEHPTPGLTPEMMGNAMKLEGLDPIVLNIKGSFAVDEYGPLNKTKSLIYSYLKSKIPVLLAVDAFKKEGDYVHKGRHAVTVCGYSFQQEISLAGRETSSFVLKSEFVDKLYVHDDQVGPFAKLDVVKDEITIDTTKSKDYTETSLKSFFRCEIVGGTPYVYAPNNVIIGLYHKIRIPFLQIEECSAKFSDFIYEMSSVDDYTKKMVYPDNEPLLWDIFLTSATEVKEELYKDTTVPDDRKLHILNASLPKYIWKASASNATGPLFDLLFDATDIPQGTIFIDLIEKNREFQSLINSLCPRPEAIPEQIRKDKYGTIYKVLNKLCTRKTDSKPDLADKFGFPRPPFRFEPCEHNYLGEVMQHPHLISVDERNDTLTFDEKKYIWAISESGDIRLAPDTEKQGHPTLVEGGYARICGEINRQEEGDGYILNNASGRYSKHNPSGNGKFLENSRNLFKERIPNLKIVGFKESSYHGNLSVTDLKQFVTFALDASNDNNYDVGKILWEIGRRTPDFREVFCKNHKTLGRVLDEKTVTLLGSFCSPEVCISCSALVVA